MTISRRTAQLIYDAITYTTAQTYMNLFYHNITFDKNGNPIDDIIKCIQDTAKQMMINFCKENDINKIKVDDENIPTDRND